MERFAYRPPWQAPRFGFTWPMWGRACDEWHNPSFYVQCPLGYFVWWKIVYPRTAPEHVHGRSGDVWHGDIIPGCDTCAEIVGYLSQPFV